MQPHRFNLASALFASFVAALVMGATSSFFFHKCLLLTMGTNAHFQGMTALVIGGILHLLVAFGYGLIYARFFYPLVRKLPGFVAGTLYSLLPFCIAMVFTNPFLQVSSESFLQTPLPKAKKMVAPQHQKTANISSSTKTSYSCCALPGACCLPCGPCNPGHPALYGCCLPCGTCEPFCAPCGSENPSNPCGPCGSCGPCGPLDFCGPCLSSLQNSAENPNLCPIASLDRPAPCAPVSGEESSCSPCSMAPFESTLPSTTENNDSPSTNPVPTPTPQPFTPHPCSPMYAPCPIPNDEPPITTTPEKSPSKSSKKPRPYMKSEKIVRESSPIWVTPLILHLIYGVVLGALYRPKKMAPPL